MDQVRLQNGIGALLLLALAWLPTEAAGQTSGILGSGGTPFGSWGRSVCGDIHILSANPDSASICVAARDRLSVLRPSPTWIDLAPPAGSTTTFGHAMSRCRAPNGSGLDALLVGDPGYAQARGRVSVYLGTPVPGLAPSFSLEGELQGDLFGAAVASLGDFNQDGYEDFAVGAPGHDSGTGRVYVYFGGDTPPSAPSMTLDGAAAGNLFGSALLGAIATAEPEHGNLVVGAPGGYGGRGQIVLYWGGSNPDSIPVETIQDPGPTFAQPYTERARFGSSLACGDFDGDGVNDLAVGGPGAKQGGGRIEVFSGFANPTYPAGYRRYGIAPYGHLGTSLAIEPFGSSGGFGLAIGCPGASAGAGAVELFVNALSFGGPANLTLSGTSPDEGFGCTLARGRALEYVPEPLLLIGAPFDDRTAPNGGAIWWSAAPTVLSVENSQVSVEADGSGLPAGGFTSTTPRIVFRLLDGKPCGLPGTHVELDGEALSVRILPPDGQALPEIPALAEGQHTLAATLRSEDGVSAGSVQISFVATRSLAVSEVRSSPNPAFSRLRIRFALTRAVGYEVVVIDAQGRVVWRRVSPTGVPGDNVVDLGGAASAWAPGTYFYEVRARLGGQEAVGHGRFIWLR